MSFLRIRIQLRRPESSSISLFTLRICSIQESIREMKVEIDTWNNETAHIPLRSRPLPWW
jgi:hypothetical protein